MFLKKRRIGIFAVTALAATSISCVSTQSTDKQIAPNAIVIESQGSFSVGGNVVKVPGEFKPMGFPAPAAGQSVHGDHAYVQFQIPVNAKKFPLLMWHGGGQSGQTWETTADGREGFKNIFVRKGYATYVIDQPGRGRASNRTKEAIVPAVTQDQFFFNLYRLGQWPDFFDGVQFPEDQASLNQYYRQMVPDVGPEDINADAKVASQLLERIGEAVLITHSASGGRGWLTRLQSDNVKGIVNYEGVQYVFPKGEGPPPAVVPQIEVPLEQFKKLTEIPIQVVFGDNIPEGDARAPSMTQEAWRQVLITAKFFVDKINEHGGDAELLHLPKVGVTGNTHFPFSDLNNQQVAELLSQYFSQKGLNVAR